MVDRLIYFLFAPIRLITKALPTKGNIQMEMMRERCLTFECSAQAIAVGPLRRRYRGQAGAWAITGALRHFEPEIASMKPPSARERARFRRLTDREMPGPVSIVFKLPLELARSSPYQDAHAWDALRTKLADLNSPISLSELQALEIAAYLETRPADFDRTAYYRSYR